jgi:hypothetical protein
VGSRVLPRKNIAVRAVCWLWNGVKEHWKKTSLFVLAAALASALISFLNYRLQLKSNEPQLASTGSVVALRAHPISVQLNFMNIGKRPAKGAIVTLFSVNEAHTRGPKLGEKAIAETGAANVVIPQYGGNVTFDVEGEAPDLFLACVIYFDDKTRLQQAFVYRLEGRGDVSPGSGKSNSLITEKSAIKRHRPLHPSRDDQVATRWPLIRMPR